MPVFRSRHTARSLTLGAITALILGAPAVVMAQDSTATQTPGKPAEVKAATQKVETKAAVETEKSEAKEHAKGEAGDPSKWIQERLEHMTKTLKLTDEQKEKVRPIMLDEMTRARAMREKYE